MDRCLREIEESLDPEQSSLRCLRPWRVVQEDRKEGTGDRSRESRREADGHIDDFVSSPVGRRSPTTAAGCENLDG